MSYEAEIDEIIEEEDSSEFIKDIKK